MSHPLEFSTIILAAGASSRMGVHKARVLWHERSFLQHCLQQSVDSGSSRVLVVWGAQALEDALCKSEAQKPQWVENKNWSDGPLASLQCGLQDLIRQDPAGFAPGFALVRSVDRPRISSQTLSTLIEAAKQKPQAVVQCVYRGKRAHPLVYPRCMWPPILALDPQKSIRPFLDRLPATKRILVPVDDPGTVENFDRPGDLKTHMRLP